MTGKHVAIVYLLVTVAIVVLNLSFPLTQLFGFLIPLTRLLWLIYAQQAVWQVVVLIVALALVLYEVRLRNMTRATVWGVIVNFVGVFMLASPIIAAMFIDTRQDGNGDGLILLVLELELIYCPFAIYSMLSRWKRVSQL